MAVPAAPPIKFTDVKAEFGGLLSTPLSAYVKGGAYVPVQTLAPIPTAVPVNLKAFAGAVFPASLAYVTANMDNGFSISSAVVAADLSTATFVVSRTKVVNGGSSWFEGTTFHATFGITGAVHPVIVLRLPATQPRDGSGYWKQTGNYSLQKVVAPGAFDPTVDYSTFEHTWHALDRNTTYQGELSLNTLIPPANAASPPTFSPPVASNQFDIQVVLLWRMDIGTATPPGSQMVWNTRNGSNTYVEFPIVIDVYDGAVLRASYPMLLHFEMNALTTFNPS